MSRTFRDRRPLFQDGLPPEHDRDHHCRVLGCYGQTQKDRRRRGEPPAKPSDQRRLDATDAQ